jgi:protein involved in polysaccharide export with SLBB domain
MKIRIRTYLNTLVATAFLSCLVSSASAQNQQPSVPEGHPDVDTYQLSIRDQIEFTVYDEPDLTSSQRIDGQGQIRVPLLGTARVAGLTIRQAEQFLERSYVEHRLLRNPMVTIRVADYAPKEVAVLGEVASPGKFTFPIEANTLNIVDVISQMGGFTDMARSENVRVTRMTEEGRKTEFTVNVERMISGRGRGTSAPVEILPGDVIWVPRRLF